MRKPPSPPPAILPSWQAVDCHPHTYLDSKQTAL